MKLTLTLFILVIMNILGSVEASECSSLVGSCDFYLCREQQHSCGDKGYYLGFSYKYCKESEDKLAATMSEQGKKWIGEVTYCLQDSVDRIPTQEICSDVFNLAVADHNECYTKAGFCALPMKDRFNIIVMLRNELLNLKIITEGLKVLEQCL